PRRDWPRSRGTPITRILRGTIKGSTARGAAAGRSCLGLSFISFSKPFHHRDTETPRKPSQKLNQRNSAKSIPLDGGYVQSSQDSVHKLTAALISGPAIINIFLILYFSVPLCLCGEKRLRVHAVEHARERNRLPYVLQAADPPHRA